MSFKVSLENIISKLTEKFQYNSVFRYRVSSDTGTKIAANAVVKTDDHPDIKEAEKVYGVPGITSTLQPNQQVLLAYEGGNPNRPYIIGFFNGVPAKLGVKVVDEMEVLKQSNVAPSDSVALAGNIIITLNSILDTLIAIEAWLVAAAAIPPLTATETLAGAVTTALGLTGTAISTADNNYPIGIKSTGLKAN